MSVKKKLICGLSVFVTMMIALVTGLLLPKVNNNTTKPNEVPTIDKYDNTEIIKPATYTYEVGDVVVMPGTSTINFSYNPSVNMSDKYYKTIAYEYEFKNTMSETAAVNIKEIDDTYGTVSYVYSLNEKLDTSNIISGATKFTTQTISAGNDSVLYVYILVTPKAVVVPSDFTTTVTWIYGKSTTVTVNSNVAVNVNYEDTTTWSYAAVDGQLMEEPVAPTAPENHYFDAWFLDADYTQLATFPLSMYGQPLYARYHNTPSSMLSYSDGEYSIANAGSLVGEVILPTIYPYNDTLVPVTTITENAFLESSITSVIMSNTITTIGNTAFRRCTSLKTVDLSKGLTTIGSYAFENCVIDNIDFSKCKEIQTLSSATFTDTSMPIIDLRNCTKLISIHDYAFSCYFGTNIILPNSVQSIGKEAFKGVQFESIKLPTELVTIGEGSFYGCTNLTDITIPSNVTTIGENAFYNSSIESVNMSASISLQSIGGSAFRYCGSLTNVNIPSGVRSIGSSAFSNCGSLTQVLLPKTLTTIEDNTFAYCSELNNINLENCTQLTSIGASAFANCTNLNSIIIPAKVNNIGSNAFSDCKTLASVCNLSALNIGVGLDTYGKVAQNAYIVFDSIESMVGKVETINGIQYYTDNTNFVAINLVEELEIITFDTRVTEIKQSGLWCNETTTAIDFTNCAKLKVIPNGNFSRYSDLRTVKFDGCTGLTEIGLNAFSSNNIITVDLSDCVNLVSIDDYAFANCVELRTVDLSGCSKLEYFGVQVFSGCSKLTSINFDGCTSLVDICMIAFVDCVSLTSVDFSSCINLTRLGVNAFDGCTALTSVDLSNTKITEISSRTFYGCSNLTILKVPTGTTLSPDALTGCDKVNVQYV